MTRTLRAPLLSFTLSLSLGLAATSAMAQTPPAAPRVQPVALASDPGVTTQPRGPEGKASELDAKLAAILAQPGGLTAEDVGKRAEATSFDVKAQAQAVEAASAEVDAATVQWFPKLSVLGRYTRLSPLTPPSLGTLAAPANGQTGPITNVAAGGLIGVPLAFPVILNNYLAQATLTIPISDYFFRTSQGYSQAEHTEKSARMNELSSRLTANANAQLTYWSWVRAKMQVIVTEQALAQAQGHLKDAQAAFTVGNVSKADVLRTESQVASNELLVVRSRNSADLWEHQVRVALHDEGTKRYEIGEDVRGDAGAVSDAGNVQQLMGEALDHRPEVRALDETALSLRDQAKVDRASYAPRLDAIGDAIYANPNQRIIPPTDIWKATWDVGVQITWTPNDLATGRAQAHQAEARASQTDAQKQALYDSLKIEVVQSWQGLREAEVSVETTQRGLASAEESYRVRRELFANGRATNVELTDAETDLTRARLEALNARVDVRVAKIRLMHATGRDANSRREMK